MDQPAIDASDLQPTGMFAGLDTADVEAILRVGRPVSFDADQSIFETGDRGDAMYVIVSGEARVDVGGRFHILKPETSSARWH